MGEAANSGVTSLTKFSNEQAPETPPIEKSSSIVDAASLASKPDVTENESELDQWTAKALTHGAASPGRRPLWRPPRSGHAWSLAANFGLRNIAVPRARNRSVGSRLSAAWGNSEARRNRP
jgi:hypothetical protein